MALAKLDLSTVKARPGARISNRQAREIAPTLLELERRDGVVTASAVLEVARDPSSPLHALFEWDDAVAAEKQRIQTAQTLIRSVVYRVQSLGDKVNEYQAMLVRVHDVDAPEAQVEKTGYASVTRVLESPVLRAQLIANAKRDLEGWIRKVETISALANTVGPARELLQQIGAIEEKVSATG